MSSYEGQVSRGPPRPTEGPGNHDPDTGRQIGPPSEETTDLEDATVGGQFMESPPMVDPNGAHAPSGPPPGYPKGYHGGPVSPERGADRRIR